MLNLNKIKELAKKKGIKLNALALKAGISQQALYQIIRNNSTKPTTLTKIAKILGVNESCFYELPEKEIDGKDLTDCLHCEHLTKIIDQQTKIIDLLFEQIELLKPLKNK